MEAHVIKTNLIHVGDFPCFGLGKDPLFVKLSSMSISFDVECPDVQSRNEAILILKKDILKVQACFESTNPFFSILLKQPAAVSMSKRMGFDRQEHWSFDSSKSSIRKSSQGLSGSSSSWITFFVILTRDFLQFFVDNFLESAGFTDHDKAFTLPQTKNLHDQKLIHQIGMHNYKQGYEELEGIQNVHPLGRGAGVILMPIELLLKIRKQAAYALLVSQPDFNPHKFKLECYGPVPGQLFSQWLLSPELTKYVDNLVCRTCKGMARLKCSWCKVSLKFPELCLADPGEARAALQTQSLLIH